MERRMDHTGERGGHKDCPMTCRVARRDQEPHSKSQIERASVGHQMCTEWPRVRHSRNELEEPARRKKNISEPLISERIPKIARTGPTNRGSFIRDFLFDFSTPTS